MPPRSNQARAERPSAFSSATLRVRTFVANQTWKTSPSGGAGSTIRAWGRPASSTVTKVA
jgi:hypothetical protein